MPGKNTAFQSIAATLLQMIFNGGGAGVSPVKSDSLEADGSYQTSPWANVISVGEYYDNY